MAQLKNVNYFLNKYQGLFVNYPNLEINILQKFNINNPAIELRLNNLQENGLSAYISGDDYPDKVGEALKELKSVKGGKKRRNQTKHRHRRSKSRKHKRSVRH
jgi:hypothetical protein